MQFLLKYHAIVAKRSKPQYNSIGDFIRQINTSIINVVIKVICMKTKW